MQRLMPNPGVLVSTHEFAVVSLTGLIAYKETRLVRLPIVGGSEPVSDASVSVLDIIDISQISYTMK